MEVGVGLRICPMHLRLSPVANLSHSLFQTNSANSVIYNINSLFYTTYCEQPKHSLNLSLKNVM